MEASIKKEMIDEIRKIERKVIRRIKRIEQRKDLPQFGAESFRKFEKRVWNKTEGKPLSTLSESELRTILRDVRYLDNLKSTSIRGATQAKKVYLPVKDKLEALSKTTQNKFWELYDKIVERFELMNRFKYELYSSAIDYIYGGQTDTDKAVQQIFDEYDKIATETGMTLDDKPFRISFTKRLEEIFK